jgi:hypothetical protein
MSEDRKRRENFSQEEKSIILDFVKQHKNILEDKSGNAKLVIAKKQKWQELALLMRSSGHYRDWKEVRGSYQRWKVAAKKAISAYRRHSQGTGGGPSSSIPSETDFALVEVCPEDFEEDENPLDSDAQVIIIMVSNVTAFIFFYLM